MNGFPLPKLNQPNSFNFSNFFKTPMTFAFLNFYDFCLVPLDFLHFAQFFSQSMVFKARHRAPARVSYS